MFGIVLYWMMIISVLLNVIAVGGKEIKMIWYGHLEYNVCAWSRQMEKEF